MHLLDLPDDLCRQGECRAVQIFLKLRQIGRTDDDAGSEPAGAGVGERHLRGLESGGLCDTRIFRAGGGYVDLAVALAKAGEQADASFNFLIINIFSAQMTESQRAVGEQADICVAAGFRQSALESAVHQVVGVLD